MKLFNLMQKKTVLAEGVKFTDGRCAVNWISKDYKKMTGMAFFDSEEHILDIYDKSVKIVYMQEENPQIDLYKYTTPAPKQCYNKDPDDMCKACDCWKMTRQYCS